MSSDELRVGASSLVLMEVQDKAAQKAASALTSAYEEVVNSDAEGQPVQFYRALASYCRVYDLADCWVGTVRAAADICEHVLEFSPVFSAFQDFAIRKAPVLHLAFCMSGGDFYCPQFKQTVQELVDIPLATLFQHGMLAEWLYD